MDKAEKVDLSEIIVNKAGCFSSPEEIKFIDAHIVKFRSHPPSKDESIKLIQTIQGIPIEDPAHLKILQLLRTLTKSAEMREYLLPEFLQVLNSLLPEMTSSPNLLIEILVIHLRYIEKDPKVIQDEMFSTILDLLVLNNSELTKIIIEITKELAAHGINQVLEEVWYVGRLLFALERVQSGSKPKLVNLIKDLLDCKHFNENFRRINGVPTLISELKRCQGSNLLLKISLLNCIYKLLLTTKTEAIYDFKLNNFISLINLKIREPMNYKELILNIKVMTHLALDNDISGKYIEEGIEDAIILLVRSHPTNCHMIKFEDIEDSEEVEAFEEFKLLIIRLLRYVASLERNRKIFKQIFPNQLLMPFIDVGHFIKPLKAYIPTLQIFNNMDNARVLNIEDEYEKLAKLFANKNYKLQVVGNYNLLEELGQGAFGSVFLAKKGSNEYALKRIKFDEGENKEGMEELSREVKIYKELKHPNIVKFYESFLEDGHLYIVMEVIKGCNLSELIRNQNEKASLFEEEIIWKLLICLLSVLRYLHSDKKIIHRDLNPSNIMVDHKFNIKVTDFGLAKNIGPQSGSRMVQSFVGTVGYSAPEMVQRQDYNEKADIWSFGCILHELMCLKPPFSGNNPLLLAKVIVNQEYSSQLPQQYSEELKNFVKKCMIMDESKRPTSHELLRDVVDRVMRYSDDLKEKESALSDQIFQLSKKINSGGLGATHTRMFGNSLYNSHQMPLIKGVGKPPQPQPPQIPPSEEMLRQTQLVKIDSDVLNKIGEDPMSKFIDVVKKLSLISSTQASLKKNFKKYIVDAFYNRVMISDEFSISEVKNELNKLINLSKEEVSFLGVKFELKQNYIKSITYEMLYFYVEELFEVIKK